MYILSVVGYHHSEDETLSAIAGEDDICAQLWLSLISMGSP